MTHETAIIIPVFNRRETTLRCLKNLEDDEVYNWATVYVVDDGSTDGTPVSVSTLFPEVRVLNTGGDHWWTGCVELGMRTARAEGARYFIWLNDDTLPAPGACAKLQRRSAELNAVVTGQSYASGTGPLAYGGLRRTGMRFALTEAIKTPLPVDAASGNFVCIPSAVSDQIGYPHASRFPQAFGDLDYTHRVTRAGLAVIADAEVRATATPNSWSNVSSWLLGDISVAEIWKGLWQKRSYVYAPAHSRFLVRHFGVRGAAYWLWLVAKRVPVTALRLSLPRQLLRRLWGKRSEAWRTEQQLRSSDPQRNEGTD